MDIHNRDILLLGGSGLVGSAILQHISTYNPRKVVILSLLEEESREVCQEMSEAYPKITYHPEWGNVFVRDELKNLDRSELLNNEISRQKLLADNLEAFTPEMLGHSFLHQVISIHKPNIIIDSINTSTALAYQDVYQSYYQLQDSLKSKDQHIDRAQVEKMLTTLYIPQIIRHIQILHTSMLKNKTSVYIKIGTTGTGGMGLNIPYTHSEERPSRVLLSKSSLAGAHTMLLFLMGRTPGGPICKEIKPAAAIAWKGIHYGEIKKRGQFIPLYDCTFENAETINDLFSRVGEKKWDDLEENLKSVYIDSGENGTFSSGEFETITAVGQMEFVTPEEIATNVILEILGDSTGHDIINALDNSIMGPTYRAGYMRHQALSQMDNLKKKHASDSVAFEILGPPRLSKILYEAHLLSKVCGDLKCVTVLDETDLAEKVETQIKNDQKLRSHALSIGIPILLKDGKSLLRGPVVKIPTSEEGHNLVADIDNINRWANAGWIDLRQENMVKWKKRMENILEWVQGLSEEDSSSRFTHGRQHWDLDQQLNIGKVAAWIFMHEDDGIRFKS
ncbi:MAG: short-chain dehydrogenase [Candidatus Marinimicrobia bacterium]|jgi:hypothetical protein|nr:short-chain dehydrogenase [Candidatus Neomarinimicrobiota bacterium]MBT3618764.1 short-chain dehydrogenase [Candidatus Neomarinimicrobiota bacterium]MBT3828331.1 short-chain dehydrogenase [Candidatus Neomarinimicrobiota bacterium]MBT3997208.1 short-chain dehydrogenase [Candidatus Neomarinimicrobiota bacterium]MBT4280194.1 short-chain dehydrogenase [Candidatus Neomarinimicrobiota bacterium]